MVSLSRDKLHSMHHLRINALCVQGNTMFDSNPSLVLPSLISNISRTIGSLVIACGMLTLPTLSHADWTGGIEGGTVIDGDDSGTRLRFKATNNERPFSQQVYADWIQGNGNGYEIGYIPKYWFTDKAYAFAEGSLRTAKLQLIDREARVLGGLGIQLVSTATQSLFAEAGVGQVQTKFTTLDFNGENATADSQIAQARFGAVQTLSELIRFELDGIYATAEDLIQSSVEAGISLAVPGGAIKYSYRLRTTEIGDAEPVDTKDSSVSFTYGF